MFERTSENLTESTEEKVGEGVGGIAGALAGAGLGSAAGPIGTIIGGIVGAMGGWWTGEKLGRAFDDWTDEDEEYIRSFYDSRNDEDLDYDVARSGYLMGYAGAENPDYGDPLVMDRDIAKHWEVDGIQYDRVRPYVRAGYDRRRSLIDV